MSSFYIVIGSLILVIVIVGFILRSLTKSGERMLAEEKRRNENALRGKARIIAVGNSRTQRQRGTILIKLRLEILPENRQSAFETTTVWEVEPAALAEIQKDAQLAVKYDEQDKQRVYPLASWANYNELMSRHWSAAVAESE